MRDEGTVSYSLFTNASCTNIAEIRKDCPTFQTAPNFLRISKFARLIKN
jgi:hypothetical protein